VFRLTQEPDGATEQLVALVDQALPVFEAAGDDMALFIAYSGLAQMAFAGAQMDAALEAYDRAFAHARQAGHLPAEMLGWRAGLRALGTTPAAELLEWLDENEPPAERNHLLAHRAVALAMLGRFDEARAILAETLAELKERGGGVLLAHLTAFQSVWVELWAGDPAAAAELGAEGWSLQLEVGDQNTQAFAAANLAQALYALDRLDEADAWASRAAERDTRNDPGTGMRWRQVRAKVLARRGEHAEAERLAREAVAICDQTDMLNEQGDVYADFGEVLRLGGKPDDAAAAVAQALDRYERKQNLVMAERTRDRLAALAPTP
jgi:tetratricopeptide (TPR) repeat protein